MKYLSLLLSSLLLQSCINIASFQPPLPRDSWDFPGSEKYFSSSEGMLKFYQKRSKDMWDCGIDPVMGDSISAKASLCMESKGWYEKKGPVCEKDPMFYDDPLCIKWRAKHKR